MYRRHGQAGQYLIFQYCTQHQATGAGYHGFVRRGNVPYVALAAYDGEPAIDVDRHAQGGKTTLTIEL